jgi:ligand-binding sensor domain-containing protein
VQHWFFLSLFCLANTFSWAQKYSFRNYSNTDGLPQSYIYTIAQGEKGFLWIGTGEGLSRFDGKNFVNFTTAHGLAENFVNTSFVDSKNRKWFGHYQGGITVLNDQEFKIINKDRLASSRIN